MQTPLEFLDVFRHEMRTAGIPFAITSGMACIRYGLQQTTKDSDWIVAAAHEHRLPMTPLTEDVRRDVYARGLADAAILANIEIDRLRAIAPPIEEVLP